MSRPPDKLPPTPTPTSATAAQPLRQRIRWLQRLVVFGALGAVILLLALIWELLPTRLDAEHRSTPDTTRTVRHTAPDTLDGCARQLVQAWAGWTAAQRTSDPNRQTLRDTARSCSAATPGVTGIQVFNLDTGAPAIDLVGTPDVLLSADQLARLRTAARSTTPQDLADPANRYLDRVFAVPGGPPVQALVLRFAAEGSPQTLATGATAESSPAGRRLQWLQWLLSVLALGLVGLFVVSLRWLSRSQKAYQDDLRQQILARQEKEVRLEQEIAARRGTALALQSEIAFREDIEESISVGLRVVDRAGQLTYVNRAFCQTSGWSREALIGTRPPYPFWPPEQTGRLDEHLHVILAGQARPDGYRVAFRRPDGSLWTAEVTARALGSGEGWILASADVTREIEDQRRIDAMNDDLRSQSSVYLLGERAGELLHKVSNHCGACLNALDGVSRNLQAGRSELLGEGVRIAARAAGHMRDIVERFRPWLRHEVSVEPASLREVVADAMAQQASYAAELNVVMHNAVSAELPPVPLDRMALCEVLGNLLRNAIWAMNETAITNRQIGIESYVDEETRQVQIHVRDRGPGVPVALREKVFERGYSTRTGGNGWGLHICRHWIEKLDGHLAVTDNLPRGADFVITLPLDPPLQKRQEDPDEPTRQPA